MDKKPKVSVIMGIYNEDLKLIKKSIESILNQTFSNFEFIIVLDNPKYPIAEEYLLKLSKKDKRIKFFRNKFNYGLPKTLNIALKKARGEFIARMDADDISEVDRFEKQLNFFKINPLTDLLFTWGEYIDEYGNIIGEFKPESSKVQNLPKNIFKDELFAHPSLIARKKIFKNNLYDETYIYSQDLELWLRCIRKKFIFSILPEKLILYRIPEKDLDYYIRKQKKGISYTLRIYLKNFKFYFYKIYFLKKFLFQTFRFILLKSLPKKVIRMLIIIYRKIK